MHKLLILMLLALVSASFTSCRHGKIGKQGEPGVNGIDGNGVVGQDGQDGADGEDGEDGLNGLNGIGFDYVRGMEGAIVCNSALIVPANLVVPAHILDLAPVGGGHHLDGLTLTFGSLDSPLRVYLGAVHAGEYCILEKQGSDGWVQVGQQLIFVEDGFVAIIPPEFYLAVSPPVFADALLRVHVVQFPGECYELHYHEDRHIKIGKDIRINFNRD